MVQIVKDQIDKYAQYLRLFEQISGQIRAHKRSYLHANRNNICECGSGKKAKKCNCIDNIMNTIYFIRRNVVSSDATVANKPDYVAINHDEDIQSFRKRIEAMNDFVEWCPSFEDQLKRCIANSTSINS